MKIKSNIVTAALAASAFFALPQAHAGESQFGWIYTADLHPKGQSELEQKFFLQHGQSQGQYDYLQIQTEYERGMSDNWQLALYVNSSDINAYRNGIDGQTSGPHVDPPQGFDTTKRFHTSKVETVSVESIWRLKNPVTDGYGLALYLEPEVGPHERELEGRVILQKNFLDDRLIVAGNITGTIEREKPPHTTTIERATTLDLTAGVSYRFANNWSAGLEARNHNEFEGYGYGRQQHSAWFLGPNIHYAAKRWWVTAAWRQQLPFVHAFTAEQRDVVVGDRIYGSEHARNEFMVKFGFPLGSK